MVKMCEQARKQEVIRLPHAKFDTIYRDLREKIEDGDYPFQSFLPSENTLTSVYGCSRNTVRRAIAGLIERGYAQAIRGKGVRVLYRKGQQSSFSIGGIETFKESAARNHLHTETRVVRFEMIEADDALAARTGFRTGTPLWRIWRLRILGGRALILDKNLFRADLVPGLTRAIAENSIYEYIEQTLHRTIQTSKRRMTVEHATREDAKYLDLGDYNCLAIIESQTFDENGSQIEWTQSRHHPERFAFEDTATRHPHA